MYQECLRRTRGEFPRLFKWSLPLPEKYENSAFIYKLAQAFLRRKIIFQEGLIEESIIHKASYLISDSLVFIQLVIVLRQCVSDTDPSLNVHDKIFLACVCEYSPDTETVKIKVLDLVTHKMLNDKAKKHGGVPDKITEFSFSLLDHTEDRLRVRIKGWFFLKTLFTPNQENKRKKLIVFSEKLVMLQLDSAGRGVKRLS